MCTNNGEKKGFLAKSTLLWTLQNDCEKISVNRRLRFHTSKDKNHLFNVELHYKTSNISKANGIHREDYVVTRFRNHLMFGQVLKFRYTSAKTKISSKYTLSSVIFGKN